ncbi:PDR/VanB family oxidoreductase [Nocardia alni]|uniref:PDR/VanB family oxidoreductase n=1 Tax=Nocardia alni TaxID=2815723 RepID=UPI001C226DDE|nr:PDR/VanB family oxidoreductase [Nocardia alni]
MSEQTDVELELQVAGREELAENVIGLRLRRPDNAPLPDWTPGAHVDLVLDDDLVRQYSLVGPVSDASEWRIGVLLEAEGRGGSRRVFEQLHPGATVRVRGPRNHFELALANRYVFIAGGIGITPLTGMLAEADRTGTPWTLTYGGRTAVSMAFARELRARYGERVTLVPQDEQGLIDLASLVGEPAEGTLIYCCGPTPLLEAVETAAAQWPQGALRFERFTPVEGIRSDPDEAFEVELALSDLVLTVPPGKSILETVAEAGIDVLSSCAEGMCGTCETALLAGVADHRDSVLTQEEKDENSSMMICVSRAKASRLVLEL